MTHRKGFIMLINYISLTKENNPEGYQKTVVGRNVNNHQYFGTIFSNVEKALTHQEALSYDERGGVIAAEWTL